MQIKRIGEFALIERIKKHIKLDASVIRGSGDDCAVLKLDKEKYQLFTCDMIIEGVDFTAKTNPYLIGRKALAVSISDIAACAGIPQHAVISLGIDKNKRFEFLDKIMKGMLDLARRYKINIVGGDFSQAKQLTIDVSMLGVVEKSKLVLRKGAKKGDIIFVTGELGGSIRGKHLTFTPRIKEARFLVDNFKINSMIDISDGLTQDLGHILEESGKGAIIYEGLIPLSKDALNFKEALNMGEDFELLFTVSHNQAKKILGKGLGIFKPIGEIVDKKYRLRLIDKRNRERIIQAEGYQHF